jgi:NADP-dependent 3-hydroxy acid dehydrogenase YdfG
MAYKQSKLANVLFTCELRKRLGERSHIRAFAADPGLVNTEMGLKNTAGIARFVWSIRKNSGVTPSMASKSLTYLALEEPPVNTDQIYFKDCKPKKASPYALDKDNALRLWEISEKMCGINSDEFGLSKK